MSGIVRRLVSLVFVGLMLVGSAEAAATWRVVQPVNCTGLGTASVGAFSGAASCCVAAGAAANTDTCNVRMALGHFFAINATFIISNSSPTYTAGATEANTTGDSISGNEFLKLGLGQVLFDICEPGDTSATPGRQVNLVRQKPSGGVAGSQLAFKFYNLTTPGGTGTGPTELTNATALTQGETVQCLLFGR